MKIKKLFSIIIASIISVSCISGCDSKEEKKEKVVNLENSVVNAYVTADSYNEIRDIMNEYGNGDYDYQNAIFNFDLSNYFSVDFYLSESENFENAFVKTLYEFDLPYNPGFLVPNKTYYYKFVIQDENGQDKIVKKEKFNTTGTVRYVNARGIKNARDIGGWTAEGGKKVKYGLIYRGSEIGMLTAEVKELFNVLGVKTEIDFRGKGSCSVGLEENYLLTYFTQYSYIFEDFNIPAPEDGAAILTGKYYEGTKQAFLDIFNVLGNKEKYPVFFHCSAGADRSGTLAFIINGLLGVDYEDLTKDFELTSFSSRANLRLRGKMEENGFSSDGIFQNNGVNFIAWGDMYKRMMEGYGTESGKLSDAIENYLINFIGVERQTLNNIKEIMLEK